MKIEKVSLIALVSGLVVGLVLELLGIFSIQDFYMRVTDMNVASWYIILVTILFIVAIVSCIIITERLQMEIIFVFIGSYIFIEIIIHLFTFIYLLFFGLGWGMLIFMHVFLIMIFIGTFPAMLFYINYDKWKDPLLFIGASFLMYLFLSIIFLPFFSTYFQWVVITLFITSINAASIVSVIITQHEFT